MLDKLVEIKVDKKTDDNKKMKYLLQIAYTFLLKNSGDVMQTYNILNTSVYSEDILALTKAIFDDKRFLHISRIKMAKLQSGKVKPLSHVLQLQR